MVIRTGKETLIMVIFLMNWLHMTNIMKAYKYHFLEPMKFYGAGREKLPPTDLKEVRIGFLGPLEGSILVYPWNTDASGIHACH